MKLDRVLLVDDDLDFAILVEDCILQAYPRTQITKAGSGEEALKNDFTTLDLVFLDYNLPDVTGADLLEKIHKDCDVPVVMLTGENDITLAVQSLKAGATDYLVKSADVSAVVPVVIERAMRERERNDESARLKQQLVQAEKMSAVGLLAAGVAHEFNNILCGMKGFAELAHDDPQTLQRLPELVVRQSDKAARITRGLLSFSRRPTGQRENCQPDKLMDEVLDLVREELRNNNIELECHYDTDGTVVSVDPAQMQQVFLNVVINARQSIDRNGTITVSIRHQEPEVIVTVSDTGKGISPQDMEKIFVPFFTRKGPLGGSEQKGTGLGLSVSYNTMQEHGGRITVESVPGKGSAFHLHLPAVTPRPEQSPDPVQESAPVSSSPLDVLAVDDECVILEVLQTILERLGHRVTTATDGKEALELVKHKRFDLVFLDLTMPGSLDGFATLQGLKESRPDVPVVVVTGRVDDGSVKTRLGRADGLLRKPFSIHDVTAMVSRIKASR